MRGLAASHTWRKSIGTLDDFNICVMSLVFYGIGRGESPGRFCFFAAAQSILFNRVRGSRSGEWADACLDRYMLGSFPSWTETRIGVDLLIDPVLNTVISNIFVKWSFFPLFIRNGPDIRSAFCFVRTGYRHLWHLMF